MTKQILIILLLLNFIVQGLEANSFSYNTNITSEEHVSKEGIEIGKGTYLSINYFKALSLMDTSFIKEESLHNVRNEKPLFLVSFQF